MNSQDPNKKEISQKSFNIIALSLLGAGVLCIGVLPWLLTQFSWGIDLTGKGEIGDTIGGTTAPFLGLIGAGLIYLSFYQQMQANKMQWNALQDEKNDQRDLQIIAFCNSMIRETKADINSADFKTASYQTTGALAISDSVQVWMVSKGFEGLRPFHKQNIRLLNSIVRSCILILKYINEVKNLELQRMVFDNYVSSVHKLILIDKTLLFASLPDFEFDFEDTQLSLNYLINWCDIMIKDYNKLDSEKNKMKTTKDRN